MLGLLKLCFASKEASKIHIRTAKIEDAPHIAKVHVDSWRTTYAGIVPDAFLYENLTYESRTKSWEKQLQADETTILVAENKQGELIGFASGGRERSGKYKHVDGELYAIYLLQTYQGQKIGFALVEAMAQSLLKQEFSAMLVWVLEQNSAKYFYEKLGGKRVDSDRLIISGKSLLEIAYVWDNLKQLAQINRL